MTRVTRFLICASAAAWCPAIAGAESGGVAIRLGDGSPVQQVNYTDYSYTWQPDAPPAPPELPGAAAPAHDPQGGRLPMEAFLESGGPAVGASCCATPPACGCEVPCAPACCDCPCGDHCGHASACPGRRLLSMIFNADRSLRASRYPLSCGCKTACCGAPACGCGDAAGWLPAASAAPGHVEERRMAPSGSTIDFAGEGADYGDIDWTIAPSPPSR